MTTMKVRHQRRSNGLTDVYAGHGHAVVGTAAALADFALGFADDRDAQRALLKLCPPAGLLEGTLYVYITGAPSRELLVAVAGAYRTPVVFFTANTYEAMKLAVDLGFRSDEGPFLYSCTL